MELSGVKNTRTGRACCQPITASKLPAAEEERAVAAFKALGHPVRLRIMHILSQYGGQVCVCDVEEQFDLTQPTISHHLGVLRRAGLVESDQQGTWVYYRVRQEAVSFLDEMLRGELMKRD